MDRRGDPVNPGSDVLNTKEERLVDNSDSMRFFWLNHEGLRFLDAWALPAYPHSIRSFFRSIERYLNK